MAAVHAPPWRCIVGDAVLGRTGVMGWKSVDKAISRVGDQMAHGNSA